ncbi:hypothetical protein QL093DRAFT_2475289 [Fusarium oxysporum]|nr:hypothetical protein QL093DRAFT_2475289 [Fusarium oxysporum]
MDSLPVEIYWTLASYLCISDLSSLVKCNRRNYERAQPFLYQTVQLNFASGIADSRTMLLLQTLSTNRYLGGLIRSIHILHGGRTYDWTLGHSQLLRSVLSAIMLTPERVTRFLCECPGITCTEPFPNLKTLVHKNIRSKAELEWVQWHMTHCSQLRSVDLSLPAWNIIPDTTIFRNTLWTHLKDLALQGFCVSQLAPAATWDLQRLDLSLCSGAETLIKRLLAMDKLSSLRSLHFAGHLSRQTFLSLLSQLSKMYQLEELSLRLGGLSHLAGKTDSGVFVHGTGVMADPNDDDKPIRDLRSLVLDKITSRSKTLKSLVLDIREVIDQPQSSMRFDLHGVQRLIGSCPIIEFIGMPVNLRASGGHRYRRMNYAKNIHLSARELKAFHLRGDYRPFTRTLNDAKHVSRPFRSRSGFEVFMGHYDKLRKVSFDIKGEQRFLRVSPEEIKSYSLNL